MKRVLELKFVLEDNSSLTITIQQPKANLSDAQIIEAMNSIVTSNCIIRNGSGLVAKKQASFVDRQVTDIAVA